MKSKGTQMSAQEARDYFRSLSGKPFDPNLATVWEDSYLFEVGEPPETPLKTEAEYRAAILKAREKYGKK